jgi:glycosyltransferase involved in cell wall biosynthesis
LAKENLQLGENMADWLQRSSGQAFVAKGGSEILKDSLYKYTDVEKYNDLNIILSTPDYAKIKFTKKNMLWQHLNYSDESLSELKNPAFVKAVDSFVYVSHWQLEKFRYIYQVPLHNATVIKNAITPIELIKKPKGEKLKLIYTSTPFRGLGVLLDAFEMLNRDDVELDIYSSTKVYGSGYEAHVGNMYDGLFDRAKQMKNVNYMGYATNEEVCKAVQSAHIFAYPSIFEETACLSMIEAGAAGCKLVTTNLGALYETGSEYATMIPIQATDGELVSLYSKVLNDEIDNYWNNSNQELLKEQSDFYNKFYSWDARKNEWNTLFDKLSSS